jgi:hypothetical protein
MEPMSRTERQRPQRATFRLPAPALLFPVLLMFCVTPLATSGGAWAAVFVIPVLALAWVVVTRTRATPEGVTAYGLLGAKRMRWTQLAGLEFNDARWAIAVGLDGSRLRLPMVRPRDLPRLVAVSGGSLNLGGPDEPAGDEVTESVVPDAGRPMTPGGRLGSGDSDPLSTTGRADAPEGGAPPLDGHLGAPEGRSDGLHVGAPPPEGDADPLVASTDPAEAGGSEVIGEDGRRADLDPSQVSRSRQ